MRLFYLHVTTSYKQTPTHPSVMVIPRRLVNITVPVLNNKPGGGHKATGPPNLIDDDEELHASFYWRRVHELGRAYSYTGAARVERLVVVAVTR